MKGNQNPSKAKTYSAGFDLHAKLSLKNEAKIRSHSEDIWFQCPRINILIGRTQLENSRKLKKTQEPDGETTL